RESSRPCPSWAAGSKALSDVLQLALAGLATGGIYALVAVGFVLLWQTSQTINFAQGEFVMLPAFFVLAAMKFGGLSFPMAALAVAALQYFLAGTRTGRSMQATAQNPALARVLGIPVGRMVLYTFLINAGLVALASFLVSPIYLAKFTNGETLGLVAFVAAI